MPVQGKDWLYFLVDLMGRTAQVENGLVVFKSNYMPLRHTPSGWQDISIGWERNANKFGINRSFSLPLEFVLEGQQILRHLFYSKNFDEKIFLLIQKQHIDIDVSNYHFYYDKFYRGELDFTTFEDTENKCKISIMEGSLTKQIKANEGTKYEFPLTDPEAITVKMNGLQLQQTASYILTNGSLPNDLGGATIALSLLGNEAINSINAISEQRVKTGNAPGPLWNANTWFLLTGNLPTEITINWDFNVYLELASGVGGVNPTSVILQLIVLESDSATNNIPIQTLSVHDPILIYNHKHHFSGTFTTTVPANRRCLLYMTANQNREFTFFTYDDGGSFEIKYSYTHRETTIKALPPFTLLKRLIGRITGLEANALSSLLESKRNLVVTSGDAIRGIEGAVIKTNLNEFFTSFNAILNAGLGVENGKIVFEDKAHFFDESNPIHLGVVKDVKIKYATEILANSIKIGWPNQTYDDVNGRQEFNTTQERLSVVERVSKPLELISVYRADPFGIELTRINLEGKTTTDSGSDNDVFILNVDMSAPNDDGTYNLKRETYDSITGLLSPDTAFNIEELTPARMLARHASWINSIFYGFEGSKLTYQTSDKNRELRTVKGSVIYDEDADFTIGESPRLLKPILFEFEPQTLSNLVELMEENPNRCFSFEHPNGTIYKGFNMKIGISPNDEESQVFQLISAPSNDLKTLIDG